MPRRLIVLNVDGELDGNAEQQAADQDDQEPTRLVLKIKLHRLGEQDGADELPTRRRESRPKDHGESREGPIVTGRGRAMMNNINQHPIVNPH